MLLFQSVLKNPLNVFQSVLSCLDIQTDEGEVFITLDDDQFQISTKKSELTSNAKTYGPIKIKVQYKFVLS